MSQAELSRDQLLAMTPERYLAAGWRDAAGRVHAYLSGSCALAACAQLEEAELAPQELGATLQAFEMLLPYHGDDPTQRLALLVQDVLDLVVSTLGQTTNPGLLAWLEGCLQTVRSPGDLSAFLVHLKAVLRQYAALIALRGGGTPRPRRA